ncbi:ribosomal-protein-S5p-alanine acetyltransferase [Cutibacterium acnes JCM 18916]|nr:ribosomal-protein-S5p-alanine acetyltransferase [Cutibacterium acnes JCM 18916]
MDDDTGARLGLARPVGGHQAPGSHERVGGYRMMITRNRRRAKEGTFFCRGRLGGMMVGPIVLP